MSWLRACLKTRYALLLLGGALACTSSPAPDPLGPPERLAQPIIGGELDYEHPAVALVVGESGICSGTVISADPVTSVGYVLTAAHCLEEPLEGVLLGRNVNNVAQVFSVDQVWSHPDWRQIGDYNDFGLIRVLGVVSNTPVLLIARPEEDTATAGVTVTSVGWGRITPGEEAVDDSIERRQMQREIYLSDDYWLFYQGGEPHICHGDSGGPVVLDTPAGKRVIGVHAGVLDEGCTLGGISSRLRTVVESFIDPVLQSQDIPAQTCDSCFVGAQGSSGVCAAAVAACNNNPECFAFENCVSNCATSTCEAECGRTYPEGSGLSFAILRCVCEPANCGGACRCSGVFNACGVRASDDLFCEACSMANCCAEAEACTADGACLYCEGAQCASSEALLAWDRCLVEQCAVECGFEAAPTPTPVPVPTATPPNQPSPTPAQPTPAPAPQPTPVVTPTASPSEPSLPPIGVPQPGPVATTTPGSNASPAPNPAFTPGGITLEPEPDPSGNEGATGQSPAPSPGSPSATPGITLDDDEENSEEHVQTDADDDPGVASRPVRSRRSGCTFTPAPSASGSWLWVLFPALAFSLRLLRKPRSAGRAC